MVKFIISCAKKKKRVVLLGDTEIARCKPFFILYQKKKSFFHSDKTQKNSAIQIQMKIY